MLMQQYRPKTLNDIKGQQHIVSYFKAVIKNPEKAHKNYVFYGSMGTGKTSLVRAFAKELLNNNNNYYEIDGFFFKDNSKINLFADTIYQVFDGYKIVVIDEAHLVPFEIQAGFLKILEENKNNIFFFFLTTELKGILQTILSRSIDFIFNKLTEKEMLEIFNQLEDKFSFEVFKIAYNYSEGKARNFLNQLEIVKIIGEENYIKHYNIINNLLDEYFINANKDVINQLVKIPISELQLFLENYILKIVKNKIIFVEEDIIKLFAFYLKIKKYIKSDNDFYSFLYLLLDFLKNLKKKD